MEDGDYGRAAEIFSEMADRAHDRGRFGAGARLALQAARAHLAADEIEAALGRARQALNFLIQGGQIRRMPIALTRMVDALRERGYETEADALQREIEGRFSEAGLGLEEPSTGHAELPAKCPSCGGPLLASEAEWHDRHTAECAYCGSMVKATSR
jgi:hypothetical protein